MNCYCSGKLETRDCCICREIIRHYDTMLLIWNHNYDNHMDIRFNFNEKITLNINMTKYINYVRKK